MDTSYLPALLAAAVLLPLASFFVILIAGPRLGKSAGAIAASAIVAAAALSFASLVIWLGNHWPEPAHHGGQHEAVAEEGGAPASGESSATASASGEHTDEHHAASGPAYLSDNYYQLGKFGSLRLEISYYIDALTICMFCMVTLIASCIHFYAIGYMHDELHEVTDHEVTTRDGSHLKRPGRFPRFFQYMSLFCFSMLGLVLAGNIAMVFVFWELVGICSYFLIGYYIERKSASNAANKAFIVNRVGDFGMIIGLMALWASLGTFAFGDIKYSDGETEHEELGLFSLVRPAEHGHQLTTPDGMVKLAAREEIKKVVLAQPSNATPKEIALAVESHVPEWRDGTGPTERKYGYWLLVLAGVGIFCGCVGKSAQFPLHVWLPDAMEGPTPVSALVHSATMVAAGVYLVGRFYPVFAPEVLLVIATAGCITLFMAATIAITATDIKRVLAYSTVSQLGYMMLALGVGGWAAGMMHLITHAFFKSLLFLCSGSVIHAVHTNEMPLMGGLWRKMPVTAFTMLIGCLAIAGASVPFLVGLSGYYSKDAILEQAFSFTQTNGFGAGIFFAAAAGGAAITAFYMFRLWFLTFTGQPRDPHRFEHAHESPAVMYVPLVLLAVFAVAVAWKPIEGVFGSLICAAISAVVIVRFKMSAAAPAVHHHADHGHDQHPGDDHGPAAHHPALSPKLIFLPLVLSLLMLGVSLVWLAWPSLDNVVLANLLEMARPAGTTPVDEHGGFVSVTGELTSLAWPNEHAIHADAAFYPVKFPVTLLAFATGIGGIALAAAFYWLGYLDPNDARTQFRAIYRFLLNKWWFDELYDWLFVKPLHVISRMISTFDKRFIDGLIDGIAAFTKRLATIWEWIGDQTLVDGFVNLFASWTYSIGLSLRSVQRGRLREYVMFIVIGTVVIFILISFFWTPTVAGK